MLRGRPLTAASLTPTCGKLRAVSCQDGAILDVLGDSTIVNALAQLLEGPSPELGFEFRLYRGPGLVGWYSGALGSDDYTVLKARLDVMPVCMATPLATAP